MSSLLSKSSKNKATSKVTGSRTWFIATITVAIIAAIAVFFAVSQVVAQTTYYVLAKDVPARTQITQDMLTPVTTSKGGQPRNTVDQSYVLSQETYAKIALKAGDTVTLSNSGPLEPITSGIPKDYVVASFVAPAETSVAGKLKRGDYIDIYSVTEGDTATSKLSLRHVLVLDATNDGASAPEDTGANETSGTPQAESAKVRTGIPTTYTIGLSSQDAAKLAVIQDAKKLVVLSPAEVKDTADISASLGDVTGPGAVSDSGKGTDSSFGAKEADTTKK
jgi:hypothetical protein